MSLSLSDYEDPNNAVAVQIGVDFSDSQRCVCGRLEMECLPVGVRYR